MDRRQFYVKSGLTNGIGIISRWKIMEALKASRDWGEREREEGGGEGWETVEQKWKAREEAGTCCGWINSSFVKNEKEKNKKKKKRKEKDVWISTRGFFVRSIIRRSSIQWNATLINWSSRFLN